MSIKIINNQDFPTDNGEEIVIDNASITYIQNEEDDDNEIQSLTFKTANSGGGKYIVIETNKWSINPNDSFDDLLNDFKKRIGINCENK